MTPLVHAKVSGYRFLHETSPIFAAPHDEAWHQFGISNVSVLSQERITPSTGEAPLKANSEAVVVDAQWIFNATRSTDQNGLNQLGAVVEGVNRLVSGGQYELLDKVLNAMPSTASQHVLLALLRSTAAVRTRMSSWQPFLNRVRDVFTEKGLDASRVLKGLL